MEEIARTDPSTRRSGGRDRPVRRPVSAMAAVVAVSLAVTACVTSADTGSAAGPTSLDSAGGADDGGGVSSRSDPPTESDLDADDRAAGTVPPPKDPTDEPVEPDICAGLVAATVGAVDLASLVEASGLAASQRNPGIVWAHNDSGQTTAVHAFGPGGAHRASFELVGIAGIDIEDIAIVGTTIHLADIGDNDAERSEIAVYRFEEPDLAALDGTADSTVDGAIDGAIEAVDVIRLRYPDGPRDAEAFVVDPADGTMLVIEKAFGFGGSGLVSPTPATVYAVTPADLAAAPSSGGADGLPIELRPVGAVAMDDLAARATGQAPADAIFTRLGLEGVATGADIRADGRLIAVRTYSSVWLFERAPEQTAVEALASEPCEAPTVVEAQGEAVTFLDGSGAAFVTVSEGSSPAWNVTSVGP